MQKFNNNFNPAENVDSNVVGFSSFLGNRDQDDNRIRSAHSLASSDSCDEKSDLNSYFPEFLIRFNYFKVSHIEQKATTAIQTFIVANS